MKYLFFILLVLFAACKTTKHATSKEISVSKSTKKDTVAKLSYDSTKLTTHRQVIEEKLDTVIKQNPIETKSTIRLDGVKEKAKEGKTDTTNLFDSLGNLVGYVATQLDTLHNTLNQTTHVQPKDVHAQLSKTTTNEGKDSTDVKKDQLTAAKTEQTQEKSKSDTSSDSSSKVSVMGLLAAFWWIPITAIVLLLLVWKGGSIWTWVKKII